MGPDVGNFYKITTLGADSISHALFLSDKVGVGLSLPHVRFPSFLSGLAGI